MEQKTKMFELYKSTKTDNLPKHIAIIMDGNGRWARERSLPRISGHREGAKRVKEIVRACGEIGIEVLTLFAFSTENWKRSKRETNFLMKLFKEFLTKEINELDRNKVRLKAIGNIEGLPLQVKDKLKKTIEITKNNAGLIFNLAVNYGARQEIIEGVKKIISNKFEINEKRISDNLYTAGLPDPDLLIRTSGEMRISNFLLWQIAYTEIYITKIFWPDFHRDDLLKAIKNYQKRERRYGGLK